MFNKRGQGLSTNAIILIILGVIILAVLVIGFTIGWGAIAPWISTDNVDKIINQCEVACSTNSPYDFCSKTRELRDGKLRITSSCLIFSGIQNLKDRYGIESCPYITCNLDCRDITIQERFGRKTKTLNPMLSNEACDTEQNYNISALAKDADGETNYCCTRGQFSK